MVGVLVEEEVQPALDVPAVRPVAGRLRDRPSRVRQPRVVAVGRLEVVIRDIGRDEAEAIPGGGGDAGPAVGRARAVAVQVERAFADELGGLAHGQVYVRAEGQQPLVGEVAEAVAHRLRLVVAGDVDADDGALAPFVVAIDPDAFLGADDLEIDEPAEGRVALGRDAGARGRGHARRVRSGRGCSGRLQEGRVTFEDAAAPAELLVERPAADLHAGVAERLEGRAGEAERVGLRVGGDEVGGAGQHVPGNGDEQDARVDVENGPPGDTGGRPADPRSLDDGGGGRV